MGESSRYSQSLIFGPTSDLRYPGSNPRSVEQYISQVSKACLYSIGEFEKGPCYR